jgi:hypothetical protein
VNDDADLSLLCSFRVDQAEYFQFLCAKIQQQAHCVLSRPFACPESGKIAVKVINHYGDEVLEVFEV